MKLRQLFLYRSITLFAKNIVSLFNTVLSKYDLIWDDSSWFSGRNKGGDSLYDVDIGLRYFAEGIGSKKPGWSIPWSVGWIFHHFSWWWVDSEGDIALDQELVLHCPILHFMSKILHFLRTIPLFPFFNFNCLLLLLLEIRFVGGQYLRRGCHYHQLLSHSLYLHHLEKLHLPLPICVVGPFQPDCKEHY